jgi:hypothetical protein
MRNSIRTIVAHQDTLPLALRKPSILAVAAHGAIYRDRIIDEVNVLLASTEFHREKFTGKMKIVCPPKIRARASPLLRYYIGALSQRFEVDEIGPVELVGKAKDTVHDSIVKAFRGSRMFRKFSIASMTFATVHLEPLRFTVTPEDLRQIEPTKRIRLKFPKTDDQDEWRSLTIEMDFVGGPTYKISIRRNDRRKYYLGLFEPEYISTLEPQILGKRDAEMGRRYKHGLYRSKDYPRRRFPVIFHRYCKNKVFDSLPAFGVDISPDVKTETSREFDLSAPHEEWMRLPNTDKLLEYAKYRIDL